MVPVVSQSKVQRLPLHGSHDRLPV